MVAHRPAAAASLLTILIGGCASTPPAGTPSIVTTLFFGLSKSDGGHVTDAEWQAFVDSDIARLFPDGFTVLSGDGTWREHDKTSHEPSRVVVIVRRDSRAVEAAIEQLRTTYCRRFSQQSVLRVDQDTKLVSFNG